MTSGAAFFLLRITENSRIKSDAAIAMISASSLAIGIIVTSLTTGMTTDVSSYMFGSILAMTKEDVALSAVLCIIVLGLFVLCYNQVFAVTFDENFAKATGVNVGAYNMLISVLTAVTIVLGMRMMGAMLISSLVIFPCLTSMRVFKSFTSVVISSGILSLVCFLLGMMASYQRRMELDHRKVINVYNIGIARHLVWRCRPEQGDKSCSGLQHHRRRGMRLKNFQDSEMED